MGLWLTGVMSDDVHRAVHFHPERSMSCWLGETMSVDDLEGLLGITFPNEHRAALLDPSDPIHIACDFLVPESPHELLRLDQVNNFLHSEDHPDTWPDHLIAFASNGCGDYFAYDTRETPYVIVYIDPDYGVAESLAMDDGYTFSSFPEWRDRKVQQHQAIRDGQCPGLRDAET